MDSFSSIVITGVGVISALGNNVDENWGKLRNGETGIKPATFADINQLRIKNVAEVKYQADDYFDKKSITLLDRFTQFALIACREAINQARLNTTDYASRIGIVLGTGVGARKTNDEALYQFYGLKKKISPISVPKGLFHAPSSYISMEHGIKGPSFMITSACASSNQAISIAASLIRSGTIDIAITGGTDACLSHPFYNGWEALRIMDPDTCRPFSRNRAGFILGEGAGILVLESASVAQARQAPIQAGLAGYGMSSDAKDLIKIDKLGATSAIQLALADSGLSTTDIDYINAHGTGTQLNDKVETEVIKDIFSEHAYNLSISSTKSMHGHALGASGAIEAVAIIKTLQESFVPPTINYEEPDPDCDLDYTVNVGKQRDIQYALSNSFAFGGVNSVLVFAKS